MTRNSSFYNEKHEFGIVGFGNIGEVLARHLLERFPNSYVNICSRRDPESLRLDLSDKLTKIPSGEKEAVSSDDLIGRVRIYSEIDGKKRTGINEKEFLDSDIIIYCARNRRVHFSSLKNRDEEFDANKNLLAHDSPRLNGYKGMLLVVTGPVEPTAEYIARKSMISRDRIILMTYIETQRFREALDGEIEKRGYKISKDEMKKAVVIGEHGTTRVPIYSFITIAGKDFLEIDDLNSSSLRRKVNQALEDNPNKLQALKDTGGNVRKPAYATIKSIEHILAGEEIPIGSFDGELFITNMTKFYADKNILKARFNYKFLNEISKREKKRFDQSREEIKRRLKTLGLK